MRHHHMGSRPHVQGSRRPLRVRHSAQNLTDIGGLVLVRKLFDWLGMRHGRPGLMTEVWIALLLYGGGVIDDLPLLERRSVRRIFGWTRRQMVMWPASKPRSRSNSSISRNDSEYRRQQCTAPQINSVSVWSHLKIAGRIAVFMILSGYQPPLAKVATQPPWPLPNCVRVEWYE